MKKAVLSIIAIVIIATGVVAGVKVLGQSRAVKAETPDKDVTSEITTDNNAEESSVSEEVESLTESGSETVSEKITEEVKISDDSSYIQWNAVPGAVKYKIYRSTSENGKFTCIGETTSLSYVDKTALPGVKYYYKVGYVKAETTTAKPVSSTTSTTKKYTTTTAKTTTTTTPTTKWSLFSTTTKPASTASKSSSSALASSYGSGQITGFEQEMLKYMNSYRSKAGVAPLTINNDLQNASRKRAYELSSVYKSNHVRPNGTAWNTILNELTDPTVSGWKTAAENIAKGQSSAADVSKEWYNSAMHRDNILNSDYKYVGFGCYEKNGVRYWDQLFVG